MKRTHRSLAVIAVLVSAALACNLPAARPAAAGLTPTLTAPQAASSTPSLEAPTLEVPTLMVPVLATLTLTATPEPPTPTATATLTETPGPDTGRIFFTQCLVFNNWCNIMVANVDGSGIHQLTYESVSSEPALSPDGKMIAFISNREGGNGDLYVMNADGSQVKRLTTDWGGDTYPSWSPDSRQIVFAQNVAQSSSQPEMTEIAVIDRDGKNVRQLTQNSAIDYAPDWAKDGSMIAFDSGMGGRIRQIYVMNPDGSDIQQLTKNELMECFHPVWSPDSRRILFYGRVADHDDIYIMNADGSEIRELFPGAAGNSALAAWSPDGKKIIFIRSYLREGIAITRLFVANSDGSDVHQLVFGKDTQNADEYPFWAK
jgi:Tol biopolymer transport system component